MKRKSIPIIIILVLAVAGGTSVLRRYLGGYNYNAIARQLVRLQKPIVVDLSTLKGVFYLYTSFFAIGHDKWMHTEGSMTSLRLDLKGVKSGLGAPNLIANYPGLAEYTAMTHEFSVKLRNESRALYYLTKIMGNGLEPTVEEVPSDERLIVTFPRRYTEETYYAFDQLLASPSTAKLTLYFAFHEGDYGDPGDLEKYAVGLEGELKGKSFHIRKCGAFFAPQERLENLIGAYQFFRQFENRESNGRDALAEQSNAGAAASRDQGRARTFTAVSPEVAASIAELARGADMAHMEGLMVNGQELSVAEEDWEDLGIFVAYHRYGARLFGGH